MLYSDNLLLSQDREVESFGFITIPALHLERNSPTSQIALDAQFEFAEYINHSEFNSQDQLVDLTVDKAISERSSLQLDVGFTRDTTLKSEQDVTGRFLDDSFRFVRWDVSPGWTYQLSPVDQIVLSADYRNLDYHTDEKTDYQYFGPTIDYIRQLNELERVSFSLGAVRFIPDEPGDDHTDTINSLIGYTYTPSELFTIGGGVGLAYSMRHEDPGQDSDELGYRVKFDMRYVISDQTSTRVSLSHDTEPSGDGDQVVRNRVTFGIDHNLTPRTIARLNLDYSDNVDLIGEQSDTSDENDDSRYVSVRPAIAYQLTEDWSLEAQYRFRYRAFEDENDSATSNTVLLTLQYNFPTWAGTGF